MAKTKMITLKVEDKPGTVAQALKALSGAGVNVESIFGWGPQGVLQIIVNNHRGALKALKAAGIDFTESKADVVEMRNKPGTLVAHLEKLAKKGVNLRSLSGYSGKSRKSTLVLTSDS